MPRTGPRPHYGRKRRVREDGYVDLYQPQHPLARKDGYVFEHRAIAWDAGLLTDPALDVHHRNGDRQDNRIENLAPLGRGEHALTHVEVRGTVKNQHGEWVVKERAERASAIERWPEHKCPECRTAFRARSDAVYCSDACRVAAWKRRRRALL